nr:MAG TPA: hypothetical protein [Caudoviricetes sp.]
MRGLVNLFAEHANVRFAAGLNFEALNLGTQTIIADSIKCFTQMVATNPRNSGIFATISGERFEHIRKTCKFRTDIAVDKTANHFRFFFGVMKIEQAIMPNGAASADKIAVELRELFFAQVRVAAAQLLVFFRVLKLAAFARFRIDELVKFFGGDSEHCELSSHSWKRPSRFALIPLSTFPPTTQGVIFQFIFPTQIENGT